MSEESLARIDPAVGRLCEWLRANSSGIYRPAREAAELIEQLQRDCGAKQAEIDRLMLEYCPQEMTPEQLAEWEASQMPGDSPSARLEEEI